MEQEEKKTTLLQVVGSVLAAMFGVQSSKSYHRDFTKGNPWTYIMVGLIFVTLFVLILYGVVKLVLINLLIK